MTKPKYVHGTSPDEQERLRRLNDLTNGQFLEFLQIQPHFQVLEVGVGLGILASQVAERANQGHVIGIEFSEQQLAQRMGFRENFELVRGDAHHLPFADNIFDLVYCRYVLEHVQEPRQVIREVLRVLKSGGRFYTQENNIAVNLFYPECPIFEHVWLQLGVLQQRLGADGYIGKKLFAYFQRAGFRDIHVSMASEMHLAGMSSFRPWVENLMKIIEASRDDFVLHGLLTRAEIDDALDEANKFMDESDAAAYFYWNRAIGTK